MSSHPFFHFLTSKVFVYFPLLKHCFFLNLSLKEPCFVQLLSLATMLSLTPSLSPLLQAFFFHFLFFSLHSNFNFLLVLFFMLFCIQRSQLIMSSKTEETPATEEASKETESTAEFAPVVQVNASNISKGKERRAFFFSFFRFAYSFFSSCILLLQLFVIIIFYSHVYLLRFKQLERVEVRTHEEQEEILFEEFCVFLFSFFFPLFFVSLSLSVSFLLDGVSFTSTARVS